jgi:SRSO17 transposase
VKARELVQIEKRLQLWLAHVFGGLGRRERIEALGNYLRGLLLEGERKSIEPMAQRLVNSSAETQAMRQRLQQAVTVAQWDERLVYERIAQQAEAHLPGIDAWVLDDTGFPKKGFKSVGVKRQYSGTMGRIDNCQVAASMHLASEQGGVCVGMRLYLAQDWAEDERRRDKTGVPEDVEFSEKWRLGLAMVDDAIAWGIEQRVVVADAAYGDCIEFREALDERDLGFIVGVTGTAVAWPPGVLPRPPPPRKKGSRQPTKWREPKKGKPLPLSTLAAALPASNWRKVTWKEGSKGPQSSRFAAIRIRTAAGHTNGKPPGDEQWLLCEWPRRQKQPSKLYLSNLPPRTSLKQLVYLAKLRWRIERDYQEMKGELGLDHFEGRGWKGFHHHAACVAAAHAFLALERARFSPEDSLDEEDQLERVPTHRAARAAALDWELPALLSADHRSGPARALANVIK